MLERSGKARAKAKKAVNLSVNAELLDEAKAFKTNISAVLECALEAEHREKRRAAWRKENAGAIGKWNDWVEKNGIPFEDLRPW